VRVSPAWRVGTLTEVKAGSDSFRIFGFGSAAAVTDLGVMSAVVDAELFAVSFPASAPLIEMPVTETALAVPTILSVKEAEA
jgi:hypothetical protein